MPKVLLLGESFNVVLREYKKSCAFSSDDRAHLERWINDDCLERVWDINYLEIDTRLVHMSDIFGSSAQHNQASLSRVVIELRLFKRTRGTG